MTKRWIMALALLAAGACGGGGGAGPVDPGGGGTGPTFSTLTLTPTTGSVAVGGSFQLVATPVDGSGNTVPGLPEATWQTSDAGRATVASGGVVTGVAPGPVTITATLTAGGVTKTATAQLTVTAAAPPAAAFTSLRLLPADGSVAVGGVLALQATPLDQNGQPMAGLGAPTFASASTATATVDAAGNVTGKAAGSVAVTASLTAQGVTRTATVNVIVTATGGGGGGTPPSSATVRGVGHSFQPSSVTIATGGTVTWTMDDEEHDITWVGAAPPGGNIPKMDEGESASRTFPEAGTYTYRCDRHENHNEGGTVVVQAGGGGGGQPPVFTSLSVSPPAPSVAVGGTQQLTATPRDQFGAAMAGLPAATWQTSDATRATVSPTGLVTGVAAGSATITATVTAGGVTRTATASVTVSSSGPTQPGAVTVTTPGETFSPRNVTIGVGGTVTWQFSGARHNVTFQGSLPPGGSIPDTASGSVSRTFTTAGTYNYVCTRHEGMTGSVLVQ